MKRWGREKRVYLLSSMNSLIHFLTRRGNVVEINIVVVDVAPICIRILFAIRLHIAHKDKRAEIMSVETSIISIFSLFRERLLSV